jgi:hypothetical protein
VQVFNLDHAVRILAVDETRGLYDVVLSVAVAARRAIYADFELSARHCGTPRKRALGRENTVSPMQIDLG